MNDEVDYVPANRCPNTLCAEVDMLEWIYARVCWNVSRNAQGRPDPDLLRAQNLQALGGDADRHRADPARDRGMV